MMRLKKYILVLAVIGLTISLVSSGVNAKTENLPIPANGEVTIPLSLKENDRVSMGFSVVGGSSKELTFYVTNPKGAVLLLHEKVGQKSVSFSAIMSGIYNLHFDNSLSSEIKTVTLNYDVEHFIMGIPQTLFLVMVITIVLVAAVAVFVMMGNP